MNQELPKFRPEEQKTEQGLFAHTLIQKEFRKLLENSEYILPKNTNAVMVLSAASYEEDAARIQLGVEVLKKIIAKKLNKNVEQITQDDFKNKTSPLLVLNGETEQLAIMKKIIIDELNFPTEEVRQINCGDKGFTNTKSHFEALKKDSEFSQFKHITLITTSYHNPRVARIALANLPESMDFDVIGVPLKNFKFDVFRKIRGEVKRIIKYSEDGEISKNILDK